MRLYQYDPPKSLSYLKLIDTVLRRHGELACPEDFLRMLDSDRFSDVTHTPEVEGAGKVQLYDGGDQRVYQFRENPGRGGTVDILFNNGRMEHFQARLLFSGILGKIGAAAYSSIRFSRLMTEVLGRGNIRYDATTHQFFGQHGSLVVTYTHELEMGLPSLSTTILTRQACYQSFSSATLEPFFPSPV